MKAHQKKYIRDNINKKSIPDIARTLHVSERAIKKYLERERQKQPFTQRPIHAELPRSWYVLAIGLIILCGWLAYSNSLQASFHLDDNPAIIERVEIQAPGTWLPQFIQARRCIAYLTFAINYHLHGLDVFGYHLVNILIHVSAASMVWWLILLTLSTPAMTSSPLSKHRYWIALFSGLVFVAHPIQVQGVTYIVQRMASLAAFFYVAALCVYVKARLHQIQKKGPVRVAFVLSAVLYVLAVFSKENAITLPIIVVVYELMFFNNAAVRSFLRENKWYFVVICMCIAGAIIYAVDVAKIVKPRALITSGEYISSYRHLLTQFCVLVLYLRLLFVPINQNIDHYFPISKSFFEPATFFSLCLLIGTMVAALRLAKKHVLMACGIWWFFITLSVESSLIPLNPIYEHRLYLPMVGFCMVASDILFASVNAQRLKMLITIGMVLVVVYAGLTYARNSVWHTEESLWEDARRKAPENPRIHKILGEAYADLGRLEDAIVAYKQALAIQPAYAGAYYNLGCVYADLERHPEAIEMYQKAIEVKPDDVKPYYNLGNSYLKQGEYVAAIAAYKQAVAIDAVYSDVYNNLGNAYVASGQHEEAIEAYQEALEINPRLAEAYNNLANTYVTVGQREAARNAYEQAILIDPQYGAAHNNLALLYLEEEQYDLARQHLKAAIDCGYPVPVVLREKLTID